MAALTTGKTAEILFESTIDTYEHQMQMIDMVTVTTPPAGQLQNAGDVFWKPIQQHRPNLTGFDLTGQETGIIQETCPFALGVPNGDLIEQRIDQVRDRSFWEQAGRETGLNQGTILNRNIANVISSTGSLHYRTNATDGFTAVSEAQVLMNERQLSADMRYMVLNDRDQNKFAQDVAGRQTFQGRPESTWKTGQIGQNVAQFDLFTGSFLQNIAGGAASTSVTADVSEKPEAGSVDPTTHLVTNIDYRTSGAIAVTDSSSFAVGDWVTFADVFAIGKADKTVTDTLMTFKIITIPNGTSITVFPKPIAADDPGLNTLELAYANINTQIVNTAAVDRVNTGASERSNIFWDKSSIEVTGGQVPMNMLAEFDGMKVVTRTLKNGLTMYMIYNAELKTLNVNFRIFLWYGITNAKPHSNGVFTTF